MSNVILYMPPGNCVQCERSKILLDREGVSYEVRLAVDYPEEVDRLAMALGRQARWWLPMAAAGQGFAPI